MFNLKPNLGKQSDRDFSRFGIWPKFIEIVNVFHMTYLYYFIDFFMINGV